MGNEQQPNKPQVDMYDEAKHDTAPVNRAVYCPFSRCTLVLSDVNGCGVRCRYHQGLIPLVTNRQRPGENGKPVTEQVKVGDKVACAFPTLRDVVDVSLVVDVKLPAGVVPFPTGTPAAAPADPDVNKSTAPAPAEIPPADTPADPSKG